MLLVEFLTCRTNAAESRVVFSIAYKIILLQFLNRWKRTADGSIMTDETGKRVLEFVAIQRRDNSQWAIPGVSAKTQQEI